MTRPDDKEPRKKRRLRPGHPRSTAGTVVTGAFMLVAGAASLLKRDKSGTDHDEDENSSTSALDED